jgi:tetratricopeptide (TPR) repeat protein
VTRRFGRLWQKLGRLNARPTGSRDLLLSKGGAGGFACVFGAARLLPRAAGVVVSRAAVVALCLCAIWWCWKIARADYLFRQDTVVAVRSAIRLVPSEPNYYMRLAQLDEAHAGDLLGTALRLNRYNAEAAIELGLRYEAEGDYPQAEKLLLEARSVDRTYLPRWSLANYYLRRDDMSGFWFWARQAARMPSTDLTPLFQLCWRVTPDAARIAKELLAGDPETMRQYIGFLLHKDELLAVANLAPRLVQCGKAETDRPLLLSAVNRLITANDGPNATALWRILLERRWVIADVTVPNNATFSRDPVPVAFDWAIPAYDGLHSWPGSSGLEAEFSGRQPENCAIAEQTVGLPPGRYEFRYAYRTSGILPGTGIEWQILDAKSQGILAISPGLSSEQLQRESIGFSVPPGGSLVRLQLTYRRTQGTPHVAGTLVLVSTSIRSASLPVIRVTSPVESTPGRFRPRPNAAGWR